MKRIFGYLLSTAMAGFFAVLPFGFIAYVIIMVYMTLRGMTDRFAESQLGGIIIHPLIIALLAGIALFLILFLVGALLSARGKSRSSWLEETFLNYVPGYLLVKGIANGLIGMTSEEGIRPAMLELLPGVNELVLIISELPDGRITVFAPTSPNAGSGKVYIVNREKLKAIEGNLMDLRETLSLFGIGSEKLLFPEKPGAKPF